MDTASVSKWIWLFGDYEIRHSYLLHLRRRARDYIIPSFWRLDDCFHCVKFMKKVTLAAPETVTVYAKGEGSFTFAGGRYAFGAPVTLPAGEGDFEAFVQNKDGLPALFVAGKTLVSDGTWQATQLSRPFAPVGCGDFCRPEDDLECFPFIYHEIFPLAARRENGGMLYDYGRETFARLTLPAPPAPLIICYGETAQEALDIENCYVLDRFPAGTPARTEGRAFRYLFLPGFTGETPPMTVESEDIGTPEIGAFACADGEISRTWRVAADTFLLCSREMYLDGIKRDRWVWSGDAYQSFFINRYLCFDESIARRTLVALRGQDPVEKHLNTILDYTFYWLIALRDHHQMTADRDFLAAMLPRAVTLADFCLARLDSDGLAGDYDHDWVFVDWADIDKGGAVCAEQMLLIAACEATAEICRLCGRDGQRYLAAAQNARGQLESFWDSERGAYMDCVASGKKRVSRHANIFALLFGFAEGSRAEEIIQNVILSDAVPPITTPYFKFFELEALCRANLLTEALRRMKAYWGGMLAQGATSFYEEYDPEKPLAAQLSMYGVPYDKSLCHAWGASPIYLLGRYFLGVYPTAPGYETFSVAPKLAAEEDGTPFWQSLDAAVPVKNGVVRFSLHDRLLTVTASRDGGTLLIAGQSVPLMRGIPARVSL